MSEAKRMNSRPSEPELFQRIENPKRQHQNWQDDSNQSTDWEALARKLRQRNLELAKTLVQLEQALAESQENLQSQIRRNHSTDAFLTQQAEELNTNQEQYSLVCRELETKEQEFQRQQILLETLNKQLEASQQQVAKLERECVLLQENCNEQSHKLSDSEKQVRELSSRLNRQQRYTLQFKAALEQCLEVPTPKSALGKQLSGTTASALPQTKSIQTWSDRPENQESILESVAPTKRANPSGKVKEILLPSFNMPSASANQASNPSDPLQTQTKDTSISAETIRPSVSVPPAPKIQNPSVAKKRKSTNPIDLPKFQRQN